jgi:small subunit ribosomal protein S3
MKLKEKVAKLLPAGTEIKISVVEVKNPDLDANIVAYSIAKQLEERASFRTAQKKAIQRVRKAGAKGCRTVVSGRLGGADIARSEGYKEGIIPLHTLRSDIDYAIAEAATQYGRLGVKVWICRGEIRPELASKDEKGE